MMPATDQHQNTTELPIPTRSVYIGLDEDAHATNTIQFYLFIFVVSPVPHPRHVCSSSIILLVAFRQNDILVQSRSKFSAFFGFNPGVVVESSFDISTVLVTMKPNVYMMSACDFPSMRKPFLLGTRISRSCATKSSITFLGLSTISTSRQ